MAAAHQPVKEVTFLTPVLLPPWARDRAFDNQKVSY